MPNDIQAQTADGVIHSFPAGTSPQAMDAAIRMYTTNLQAHNQLASTSMNKVDPITGGQVTPQQEQDINNRAASVQNNLHTPVTNASLIYAAPILGATPLASLGKFASSAGTGLLGAGAGRFAARELGGGEDAQDAAGFAGGMLGSIAGYHEPPARVGFGRFSVGVPDYLRPAGAAQEAQQSIGAFMNRGYKPAPVSPEPLSPNYTATNAVRDTPFTLPAPSGASSTTTGSSSVRYGELPEQIDPLAQAVKNRTAAYLPTRMPTQPEPTPQVDPLAQAVKNRTAAYLPTRMPAPPEVPEAIDPLASAVKNRTAAYLPTRMPTRAPVGAVTAPLAPGYSLSSGVRDTPFTLPAPSPESVSATSSSPVTYAGASSVTSGETAMNGSVARPAGSLIKTPDELRSFDQMMSIAKRNASERGMQFAGGMVPAEGRKVPYTPTATTYDPFSSSRGTTQFDEFGNPIKRNQ